MRFHMVCISECCSQTHQGCHRAECLCSRSGQPSELPLERSQRLRPDFPAGEPDGDASLVPDIRRHLRARSFLMISKQLFMPTLVAIAWPAVAQVPSAPLPGNTGAAATSTAPSAPQDGIVFYNGRSYLLRGGRASLIDSTLVPNGQVLTNDGQLLPLAPGFTGFPSGTAQGGAATGTPPSQTTRQGQAAQQNQGSQQAQPSPQMPGTPNRGTSPTGAAASSGAAGTFTPGIDNGTGVVPNATQPSGVQRTPVAEPGLPNTLPGPANVSPVAPSPGTLAPANAQPGTRTPGNVAPGNTSPRSTAPAAGNSASGTNAGANAQPPAQGGARGTGNSGKSNSGTPGGTGNSGARGTSGSTGGGTSGGGAAGGGSSSGGSSGGSGGGAGSGGSGGK